MKGLDQARLSVRWAGMGRANNSKVINWLGWANKNWPVQISSRLAIGGKQFKGQNRHCAISMMM